VRPDHQDAQLSFSFHGFEPPWPASHSLRFVRSAQ
jgi:hypothetical protein